MNSRQWIAAWMTTLGAILMSVCTFVLFGIAAAGFLVGLLLITAARRI